MLIKELVLFGCGRRYNSTQYVLKLLNVDKMRNNFSSFKKSNKCNSRHSFILQLDLSMVEENSLLFFHSKVVLIDVNKIKILKLIFIGCKCFYSIFQKHFPIKFIKYHNSRIEHCILLSNNLLTQEFVVKFVLVGFIIMIHVFS